MDLEITLTDFLTVLAIVIGPIAAVQVQKRIEAIRDRRGRQLYIFRTLMATRATPLAPDHVTALNLIDIDFSEKRKKEKSVVRAWHALLDQFGKYPNLENYKDRDDEYKIALNSAIERAQDLLIELLSKMAEYLGYDFETIHIRNGCYAPTGHAELENDYKWIRKGILLMLEGKLPINMNISSLPEQAPHESTAQFLKETSERQKQILDILNDIAEGKSGISVSLANTEAAKQAANQ